MESAGRAAARDERFLGMALRLASRGAGRTSPNPMVGAVVVSRGRVVGRGYHSRAGAPHAEVVALRQAGARARGATVYVNLEPCCHFGRTPPCVDAIIAAGVKDVVASMKDPDRRVNGAGIRRLRAAGIGVRVGGLRRESSRMNERFLRFARSGRPFVTLKAGMSLDGRIATRGGESRWITSARSRGLAHELRRQHDAVLVGVNTVLADDPGLTARRATGQNRTVAQPARVVLDARLRTPPRARLLRDAGGGPVVLVTLRGAPARRRERLEKAGALVLEVPGRNGRIDLRRALRELGRRCISSVLIEGGSEVLGCAIDTGIGDRLVLFVAGRLLGGRAALPVIGGRGAGRLSEAVRIADMTVHRLGGDFVVRGRLLHGRRRRSARRRAEG